MPLSFSLLSLSRIVQWSMRNIDFSELKLHYWNAASRSLDDPYVCDHSYTVEIMSFDPGVLYVNDFAKEDEIEHLLSVA